MKINYKGFDIEGSAAEVMELIDLAAGEAKPAPVNANECDGEICVGDCDKCVIMQKSKTTSLKNLKSKTAKKTKAKTAKRELDVPKMRALRNANWTLAQIADEMRCSPQTVSNKLKEA